MVGGVIGAQWGVDLGEKLKAEQLRAALAYLVLGVAMRMAFDLVANPSEFLSMQEPRRIQVDGIATKPFNPVLRRLPDN